MGAIDHPSSFDSDSDYFNPTHSSPKKVHQFYFVKFHPSFLDLTLKQKIEKAQELRKRMDEARARIRDKIISLEENKRYKSVGLKSHNYLNGRTSKTAQILKGNIEYLQRQLEIQWPNEHNDNDLEDININIDDKIDELSKKLNHGTRNLAEERRIVKELKELKKRKEKLAQSIETKPFQMLDWNSKAAIQERLAALEEYVREIEERGTELTMEYEAIEAETQRMVTQLEKKEAQMNLKKARANQNILKAKMQLNEQVACYEGYMTLISDAQELAKSKDFVALEDLCYQQVEEFMSHWNEDELFRANYQRSVTSSLRDRRLSCDGRMRNLSENFYSHH